MGVDSGGGMKASCGCFQPRVDVVNNPTCGRLGETAAATTGCALIGAGPNAETASKAEQKTSRAAGTFTAGITIPAGGAVVRQAVQIARSDREYS